MSTLTVDDMVRREVFACLSSLVSTVATGYGRSFMDRGKSDLLDLAEQAFELSSPVLDYEEAARQAGWEFEAYKPTPTNAAWPKGYWWREADGGCENDDDETLKRGFPCMTADTAESACGVSGVEPYEWEIFEHWNVSTWLAEKLEAKGERVDKDFAGLCVWGRATTGQGIASDGVILGIHAELMAS